MSSQAVEITSQTNAFMSANEPTGHSFATKKDPAPPPAEDRSPGNPDLEDGVRLGTAGGERAGKNATPAGKKAVVQESKENGFRCATCKKKMVNAKQTRVACRPCRPARMRFELITSYQRRRGAMVLQQTCKGYVWAAMVIRAIKSSNQSRVDHV